jgi:hypothetical protein
VVWVSRHRGSGLLISWFCRTISILFEYSAKADCDADGRVITVLQ